MTPPHTNERQVSASKREDVVNLTCAHICRAIEEAERDIDHAIEQFLNVSISIDKLLETGQVVPSAESTIDQMKGDVREIVVSLQSYDLLKQRLWSAVEVLRGPGEPATAEWDHLNRLFSETALAPAAGDLTLFATDDDGEGGAS